MRLKEEFEPDLLSPPSINDELAFRQWCRVVEMRRIAWVKSLMDPEAKQVHGVLRMIRPQDGSVIGECCLGRLCTVLADGKWDHFTIDPNSEAVHRVAVFKRVIDEEIVESHDTMPATDQVAQWLYVPGHVIRGFAEMNDGGKLTFRDIALCAATIFSLCPPSRPLPDLGCAVTSMVDWVTNNLGERAFFKSQPDVMPGA